MTRESKDIFEGLLLALVFMVAIIITTGQWNL